MVFWKLVTAWRLADWPTRRSPEAGKATMDGVVLAPSELGITLVCEPSMTATQELVVPRSMPITLAMIFILSDYKPEFGFPGLKSRMTHIGCFCRSAIPDRQFLREYI